MESLAIGAALGNALGALLKVVSATIVNVRNFKSSLSNIQSTISKLEPIFNEIQELYVVLGRDEVESAKFNDLLTEGTKLVNDSLLVKSWEINKRHTYATKLDDFKSSLNDFLQVFVIAGLCRDVTISLAELKNNGETLDKIKSILSDGASISNVFSECCNVPVPPEFVVGLKDAIEEVKDMLLNSDVKYVVISAPGGCGKTTLVKKLCHDQQIKDCYEENILFVIVSRKPNPSLIVQKIFQSKNWHVPQFQSDEDAITQLEILLRKIKGPLLVVLDDVWSGSESLIENIIEFKIPGYKVVVTSRSEFPRFRTYKLKLLNEDDALNLFSYSLLKDGNTYGYKPDYLMKKDVVRSCGGFPLALKVIGRSLCGQPEYVWKGRKRNVSPINSDLLHCLKPSIDALDAKLKECFLDLASFSEDQKIPASALQDIWEEHEINTLNNLHQLSTRNLIDLLHPREGTCDIIDECNEQFVMQHDLLRELAIYLTRQETIDQRKRLIIEINQNKFPKWLTEENQWNFQARLLSISTDETFSLAWCDVNLPSVELLILNFRTKIYSLPHFIQRMRLVKVVIITNNGSSPGELINMPFLGHLINLKRIRLEYISFPSFYVHQLKLKGLQKITLSTCEIGNAFNNSTLEISALWPNLEEINIDFCHDLVKLPVTLCELIHLKKLCITNCHNLVKLPQEIGKLTNLEALSIHSCTRLSLLPDSVGNLSKLNALDISDCIRINNLPTSIGELCAIRYINMKGCEGLNELPSEVSNLVQLKVVLCDEYTALLWDSYQSHLSNMEIRVVTDDPSKSFCNIMC